MHTPFVEDICYMIDTGDKVYFTSRVMPFSSSSSMNSEELHSLFCFDKESEEVYAVNTARNLSSNVVATVDYSPSLKALVAVNSDLNVDLLYDDGKVKTISDFHHANIGRVKKVNSIFIDNQNDRIYLATNFGYVELNSKKLEVAESRIYDTDIKAVGKVGSKFLMISGNKLLSADNSARRASLSDYSEVAALKAPSKLINVGPDFTLLADEAGSVHDVYSVTESAGEIKLEKLFSSWIYNAAHVDAGVSLATGERFYLFAPDGSSQSVMRQLEDYHQRGISRNLREVWLGKKREGIWSKEVSTDGTWTVTRDMIAPNSPAQYVVNNMAWHPSRGLLVINHGDTYDMAFGFNGGQAMISSYKDGRWDNISPVFTVDGYTEPINNPRGLAIDPNNEDYVYIGSVVNGMERINLSDGNDVIHLSRENDAYKNSPNFVGFVKDQIKGVSPLPEYPDLWSSSCPFSAPKFDFYGNLWVVHSNYTDQIPKKIHLFCWTPGDRAATTSAQDIKLPTAVYQEGILTYNQEFIQPLTHNRHKNLIFHTTGRYDPDLSVIDTNGTATDNSDDKIYQLHTFVDQDGNTLECRYIRFIWEDLSTGYVWIGHDTGIFYLNPDNITNGTQNVTRIKVARNDGTNLADYLLDGVPVLGMTTDGAGRKWFATKGGGVVCTSSDGRTIEKSLNTGNSELPDDIVYTLTYIPTSNSMMIGTNMGLAEYFIDGSSSGSAVSDDDVRIYPNPVRPGYAGYVTIDRLPKESLVKIVDASGNLIKELGVISDGEAKWDVTDTAFRRVSSGVYFILCSATEEGDNFSNVGKVLVVN